MWSEDSGITWNVLANHLVQIKSYFLGRLLSLTDMRWKNHHMASVWCMCYPITWHADRHSSVSKSILWESLWQNSAWLTGRVWNYHMGICRSRGGPPAWSSWPLWKLCLPQLSSEEWTYVQWYWREAINVFLVQGFGTATARNGHSCLFSQ